MKIRGEPFEDDGISLRIHLRNGGVLGDVERGSPARNIVTTLLL
jgi:hypothetical protein